MNKTGRLLFGMSGIVMILIMMTANVPNIFFPDKYNGYSTAAMYDASASDSKCADSIAASFLNMFGLNTSAAANQRADRPYLTPCGTPFGIKLLTDGVVVTGFGKVGEGSDIFELSPAGKAGIEKGDIIVSVNNVKVTSASQLSELITAAAKSDSAAEICYTRDGNAYSTEVMPITDTDGMAKIGVWVRDSTAGIGTMTFYDSNRGVFAGLGHAVCDIDTGCTLPLGEGEIVPAVISSVIKGEAGAPGELCGAFSGGISYGTITDNCDSGLYGTSSLCPVSSNAIPMAFANEVKPGSAYIISTIDSGPAQCYEIKISGIDVNSSENKNMVIEVTDSRLADAAGGIVQGMSGSPIIQNGMLVGAVTHVMINDPLKGYGIFAETMYNKSLSVEEIAEDETAA